MNVKEIPIIPTPKEIEKNGDIIKISPEILTSVEGWMPLSDLFESTLSRIFEKEIEKNGEEKITLCYDECLGEGEYRIDGTYLYASDYFGAANAIATLVQLINEDCGVYTVENYKIFDKSDNNYRSFMVDLARYWHRKEAILTYIDLCFFYKIKYLHLHFMDTGCHTLPSKRFPLLTHPTKHYSYEDIEEIRGYAKERGVTLIPEIEMPGHGYELFRAYPEIFADEISEETEEKIKNGEIKGVPGYYRTAVCVGRDECIEGLYDLIDEIIEMFPDAPYIHIGGDEAPHEIWNYCPVCKKKMEKEGLKDSNDLYCHAVSLFANHVVKRGRIPMVWEGFPSTAAHLIPKETVVLFWDGGFNSAPDLLSEGFKVVNASWNPMYIAPGYKRYTVDDILNWSTSVFQNKDKHRASNFVDVGVNPNVIGATLCAWEAPFEQEISYVLDLLPAFSEKLWRSKDSLTPAELLLKCKRLRGKVYHFILARD